jgi:LCP family protein required for cell wall assembly
MISRYSRKLRTPTASDATDDIAGSVDAEPGSDSARHRRKPVRRISLFIVVTLLGVVGLGTVGLLMLADSVAYQVNRTPDVFAGINEAQRPPATEATTFLLIGTDSGDPEQGSAEPAAVTFPPGSQRNDVVMLARINKERSAATVVSLPREGWVILPGHGKTQINAGYSFGGPTLLVQTVEALTNIRVDHFGVIDFAGFHSVVDLVGGIDVAVDKPTTSGAVTFQAGMNHLDGQQALAYARQRTGLPRGEVDRVQRRQSTLRALLSKIAASDTFSHPVDTYRLLDTFSHWVSVDDTLSNNGLRSLVFGMRNIRPDQVTFLTAPVAGLGREGAQSVAYLDVDRASELWHCLVTDDVGAFAQKYPDSILGISGP